MKQVICKLTGVLAPGEARVFPFFRREDQVWRTVDRILAAANTCLKLSGPPEHNDDAFVCPWHGTLFNITHGRRIDGPASANARLMILPPRVVGEALVYVWGEPS